MVGPIAPYPGVRPFETSDAAWFFGRELLVARAWRTLTDTGTLALVGPAASGKSSFIRAGLLAAAQSLGGGPADAAPRVSIVTPAGEPMRRLEEALRQLATPGGALCLLVVDQFEEVFRWGSGQSEGQSFVDALSGLYAAAGPIHLVVSLNAAFVGDCGRFAGLFALLERGLIFMPPLGPEERRAAIVRPAQLAGIMVEPEVADRIAAGSADHYPDDLVLMQHTLSRMWTRVTAASPSGIAADDRSTTHLSFTMAGYEAVGGVSRALELHAEEIFGALPDDDRRLAERVFKTLTTTTERGQRIRYPAAFAELAVTTSSAEGDVGRVAAPFIQAGLLRLSAAADTTVVDVSHEALLRSWQRLRHWMDQERSAADAYVRVLRASGQHAEGTGALLAGPELAAVRQWVEQEAPTAAWAERYGGQFDEVMRYINASANAWRAGSSADAPPREGIFISYRRDLSAGDARQIAEVLADTFGGARVFIDVDSLPPGTVFEDAVRSRLRSSAVVLVLIGRYWLTIQDDDGQPRLQNPGDFVRLEVREAINSGATIIPVLLGAAPMPKEDDLPPDIARLTKFQSVSLSHTAFKRDLDTLIREMARLAGPAFTRPWYRLGSWTSRRFRDDSRP